MMLSKFRFIFKPVETKDRPLVHEWLVQPHVAEWIHGVGLQNTLNGLEKFFQGESNTTYWIGYDKDIPFAFLNGYGSILLKWVIGEAKKVKCDQVHLDSGPQRHDAHRLYLNYGFKIIGHHFSLDLKENA